MEKRTLATAMALHARPLDAFVRLARQFSATITLQFAEREADGKNVIQLLLLAVGQGDEVTLIIEGPEESAAAGTLADFLAGTAQPLPAAAEQAWPIKAIPGAPGIAIGLARREQRLDVCFSPLLSPEQEHQVVTQALNMAREATRHLIREDDPFSDIFRAQSTILDDEALHQSLYLKVDQGLSALQAVQETFAELKERFAALDQGFAAERHADIADLHDRLLQAMGLAISQELDQTTATEPAILIVEEATPSRLASLDRQQLTGVISYRGGPTSHAAIVARGRQIPLVFMAEAKAACIEEGQRLLVDGERGLVDRAPSGQVAPERIQELLGEAASLSNVSEPRTSRVMGPSTTQDGTPVWLRANLGAPGDLALAQEVGCHGCGLLRSELLFSRRAEAPSVEEQTAAYVRVARALAPHPVVVRLFDASADKPLVFLPGPAGEDNPALGLCGIKLLLTQAPVLVDQLAAIGLARQITGLDLRALVPMVVDERDIEAVQRLAPPGLPLGVMIETPAAALRIGSLARRVSFISIGTNDLSQYVLAADRALTGSSLTIHPAVLQLMAQVVREAQARHIECSVCGEVAGNSLVAPLLVGLGINVLSLAPALIPTIRAAIQRYPRSELEALAQDASTVETVEELEALLEGFPEGR